MQRHCLRAALAAALFPAVATCTYAQDKKLIASGWDNPVPRPGRDGAAALRRGGS
ncbi:MAG: hypothetical protein HPY69_07570 [Armatimonadetes bacterium]|nr:hypothetical protein [Armatimonadota bacterium]